VIGTSGFVGLGKPLEQVRV